MVEPGSTFCNVLDKLVKEEMKPYIWVQSVRFSYLLMRSELDPCCSKEREKSLMICNDKELLGSDKERYHEMNQYLRQEG